MLWFRKGKSANDVLDQRADAIEDVVSSHKEAKNRAVIEAKQANEQLKELLSANGFTLKIYLAAGGRQPKTHKGTT